MDILIFIIIFMNILTLFNVIGYVVLSEKVRNVSNQTARESMNEFRDLLVSITTIEISTSVVISVVYAIAYALSTF